MNAKRFEIDSTSNLGDEVIKGLCNGEPFVTQLERNVPKHPMALELTQYGAQLRFMVTSPRVAELHALMPHKAPLDLSRFVLSPMPGLLTQVLVQVGQKVLAGERLAVIEAMKWRMCWWPLKTRWSRPLRPRWETPWRWIKLFWSFNEYSPF